MQHFYLLWATGEDRPGIASAVTEFLYKNNCNLEDSSMMRLGSEFGILLIFTSPKKSRQLTSQKAFPLLRRKFGLTIGVKSLSKRQATYTPQKRNSYIVSLHGPDRPGLVYHLTKCLAQQKFNITDLSTHRTRKGGRPGYIVLVEGELKSSKAFSTLKSRLSKLQSTIKSNINIRPITFHSL